MATEGQSVGEGRDGSGVNGETSEALNHFMTMATEEVQVIHSWSAPRSLSTSLMYSFAQVFSSLFLHPGMHLILCDSVCFLTVRSRWPFDRLSSFLFVWVQRDDMDVVDEPLYANFLRITGLERPYRDELLAKMVMTRYEFLSLFFLA